MIVVSPIVFVVAAEYLYPPPQSVAGRRGSRVWSLTLLMLMVATFMSYPPRLNFVTTKFLRLTDVVTYGPIFTSRTVPMRIMVFFFDP